MNQMLESKQKLNASFIFMKNHQDDELNFLLLIASAFLINGSLIAITLFLWKSVWLNRILIPKLDCMNLFGCEFYFESQSNQAFLCENLNHVRIVFTHIMSHFPRGYFLECCGFDGLTLIMFQRKMLIGLVTFSLGYLCVETLGQFERFLNEYQLLFIQLNIKPNKDFIISSLFLIMIFRMLIEFRKEMQDVYLEIVRNDEEISMKLRTLYISDMPLDDFEGITAMLDILEHLHKQNDPGKIMEINIIPDYTRLLELEIRRLQLRYEQNLIEVKKPFFYFQTTQIRQIEREIDSCLKQPFKISGHAFILVNHLSTSRVLQNYKAIELAPDFLDLNWQNITSETKQGRFWRIVILNLIIAALLLYVTSPKALYNYLSQFEFLSFLTFKWTKQIPDPFGKIIAKNIPPLILISFNQVMLFIFDIITQAERHPRYSQYQISFLHKMFYYLLLNSLIVPAFFLSSSQTLFTITYNGFNIQLEKAFELQYLRDLGLYYFTFIMYSGSGAMMVQLMRPSELWFNWLSPFVAHFFRLYENDCPLHLRTNEFCMQYGYISAQMLLVMATILIFNVSAPIVLVGGIWYFGLRLISDCYTLIVVNKKEIESNAKYLFSMLQLSCFTIGLWLLVKIVGCWLQEDYLVMTLFLMEFGGWVVVSFIFQKPFVDWEKIYDDNEDIRSQPDFEAALKSWKEKYKHPLYKG